jgi:protein CpxP
MKYSPSIVRKFIFPSLLAISIPLAANAEPQAGENWGHNGPSQFSGEEHHGHHFGHGKEMLHFPPGIDLTESQRDKIFSIKHTQEALFYEQGKIVRKAHIDLHKLATSDQYDDDKAKAITDSLGKALAKITFLKVQEKHQIYALLTPEQRNFCNSHHFEHSSGHPKFPLAPENGKPGATPHP